MSGSLKPFGYTPHAEGHFISISSVSDVIPDYINFDSSVHIDELIVHEPKLLKKGKNSWSIDNTMYSYE